jgi:hypothetical protein
MAQWVLELSRAGVDITSAAVATTGDGGVYVAVLDESAAPYKVTVLRTDTDGAILWQKQASLPGGANTSGFVLASGGGNVVLGAPDFSDGNESAIVLFDGSDGSIVWQKVVPFLIYNDGVGGRSSRQIAITPAGDVIVAGQDTASGIQFQCLFKLAAADGALVWSINPRASSTNLSFGPQSVCVDSAGDILIALVRGASGQFQTLYKYSGTDGSLIWAVRFVHAEGVTRILAAVDPSDNVYVVAKDATVSPRVVFASKVDSSGATLWDKTIELSDSGSNNDVCAAIAADAGHLYIGSFDSDLGATYLHVAVMVVNAAGTSVGVVRLENPVEPYAGDGALDLAAEDGEFFVASYERVAGIDSAVVWKNEDTDLTTAAFTPFQRTAVGATITTGGTTITSDGPSIIGDFGSSVAAGGVTTADDTLDSDVYPGGGGGGGAEPLIRFAYSFGPTAQFGEPRNSWSYPAESLGPTAQFGTPALDYNLEAYAESGGPFARFGVPYGFEFFDAFPANYAAGLGPTTRFGTPSAVVSGQFAAAPLGPTTQFGAPIGRMLQAATSLGPTAQLGTPAMLGVHRALSLGPTAQFGEVTLASIYAAQGFLATKFGTPKLSVTVGNTPGGTRVSGTATGFLSTVFGAPTSQEAHLAASLRPQTQFGVPSITRTCP